MKMPYRILWNRMGKLMNCNTGSNRKWIVPYKVGERKQQEVKV